MNLNGGGNFNLSSNITQNPNNIILDLFSKFITNNIMQSLSNSLSVYQGNNTNNIIYQNTNNKNNNITSKKNKNNIKPTKEKPFNYNNDRIEFSLKRRKENINLLSSF